jgi:DNA invertase Pin-like site-specific DNA recombinase
VSTSTQGTGLEAQIRQVQDYCKFQNLEGVEIFTDENQSGVKASRPGLDRMMAAVRKGEISSVIVPSFSRLARSTTHLLKALDEFRDYSCSFISLSERLDTSTAAGKMAFTVLAAVSQLERELLIERVRVGLANARAKGKLIGRKKTRPSELIRALLKSGMSIRAASRVANCSHGSISLEKKIWQQETREKERLEKEQAAKLAAGETLVLDETAPW